MVSCAETEASDGNEADRGSELSDNDESRQREATQPLAAAADPSSGNLMHSGLLIYPICPPFAVLHYQGALH